MALRTIRLLVIAGLLLGITNCGRKELGIVTLPRPVELNDQQVARLLTKKIFFGHQSVGNNIIEGIRDLASTDSRLTLKIVKSNNPQSILGPAFVEHEVGMNGNVQSKNEAFDRVLARGMGVQGGVAMLKYCYVDIDSSTDVLRMFEKYREEISSLKTKYPSLKIVHVTVPLTKIESTPKTWVKNALGRVTSQRLNATRNQFNQLLKQKYAGTDAIFDLAEVESTHPDGSRSYFKCNSESIYTLAPEYTTDGGHLNKEGSRAAAAALLEVLAKL